MPSGKALAECTHWAAVLGCSAATGELPAVGLRLLNDLVHLLYCSGPAALQVRTLSDISSPALKSTRYKCGRPLRVP